MNQRGDLIGGLGWFPFTLHKSQGFKSPNHQSKPPTKCEGLPDTEVKNKKRKKGFAAEAALERLEGRRAGKQADR